MAQRHFRRTRRPVAVRAVARNVRKRLLWGGLLAGGGLCLAAAGTVLWWSKDLPNPQTIDERRRVESTKIFDRTGEHLLYEIGDVHRTVVPLDNISRYVRQATLAAEDDQFYEHHGLDFLGIIRGVILKPISGQRAQGGSTITQQLIKNSILTPERTVQRKVKEAVLALELEQRFGKDQILEMYLNDIPYGNQAYGVEAAAKQFFGIGARDLSLAQASVLAALPKAPTYYSPYGSHFEDLKGRQEYILQRMVALEMITQAEADAAVAEELVFLPRQESIRAPHFVFYVKELLDAEYGERVVEQGGLSIRTTLDVKLQEAAETALRDHQTLLTSHRASNAALVATDPATGDVLAMAGSIDYFNEEIDGNVNVAIRHRSPGSSIKPFVYAAAFGLGYTPETVLVDAETDFGQDYRPRNYDLQERGPVTMRQALANSLNIPAVQTLYLVGVREATELAQRMGMTSLNDPDRYGLSLVLGGGEVRLLDEVLAYGVFANDGVRLPERAVLKIETPSEVLFDADASERASEEVLDPEVARQVSDVLSDNAARGLVFGTRNFLTLGSRPVAAKTGTTQEFRDGWTAGYTPSLAAGVWVGNNDNTPMGNRADGSVVAAPIWNQFMRQALEGVPIEQFTKPAPRQVPHGVLRNELPELKGRFEPETGIVYTAECPVAVGIPKTFKELHSILFYVRRTEPLGQPPARAESDPQFARWEAAVAKWRDKHNEETKNDPQQVRYGAGLPEPICGVSGSEDLPNVRIVEPRESVVRSSPVTVEVEIDSPKPLQDVRFLLDGEEFARRGAGEDYTVSFSFPSGFSGRKTLVVLATTEDKLIGRGHRTFIINPDASPPTVTLHTPQDGQRLTPSGFPLTAKVTAKDASGIELVDVLYQKEGESGTQRIGRTSTKAPTAPDRYEMIWGDSPGPGTYYVYAVAYDTTGNVTETDRHTVVIE